MSQKLSWRKLIRLSFSFMVVAFLLTACSKNGIQVSPDGNNEEATIANEGRALEQTALPNAIASSGNLNFESLEQMRNNSNIVQIAVSNPNFSSLVAAVVKTGLVDALSNANANLTVFAPTNTAFAQLPSPFNNSTNISAITDVTQINFLRDVLLYHVIGSEVFSNQIASGRSSAVTIKSQVSGNDNTIYFSNTFRLIRINGQSNVVHPNLNATNGVIHVIDKVLLPPTNTIAGIAIGNPDFSTLVAALVKTNLAGVFSGNGDFTVFAPTNAAFAQLPSPFNNAQNINGITNQVEIDALANILKYHVIASRYFAWDLGILQRTTTIAAAPNNKVTTSLGFNRGFVKGDANNTFSRINPADILATNGVIQVIDRVLLPK